MKRLPATLLDVVRHFSDPQVAHDFFVQARWPHGACCPRRDCGSMDVARITGRNTWRCRDCKRQFSVKNGTVFEDSPIGFGIVERKGKVRAFVIEDTTRNTLHGKIKEHVAEGSDVHTDAWKAYGKLTSYAHFVINHDVEYVNGNIHTNNIENFHAYRVA